MWSFLSVNNTFLLHCPYTDDEPEDNNDTEDKSKTEDMKNKLKASMCLYHCNYSLYPFRINKSLEMFPIVAIAFWHYHHHTYL